MVTNRDISAYDKVTEEVCEDCKGLMRGGPEACATWCVAYQDALDKLAALDKEGSCPK